MIDRQGMSHRTERLQVGFLSLPLSNLFLKLATVLRGANIPIHTDSIIQLVCC